MNFFLQEFFKELRSYRSLRSLRSEDKCLGGNIYASTFAS